MTWPYDPQSPDDQPYGQGRPPGGSGQSPSGGAEPPYSQAPSPYGQGQSRFGQPYQPSTAQPFTPQPYGQASPQPYQQPYQAGYTQPYQQPYQAGYPQPTAQPYQQGYPQPYQPYLPPPPRPRSRALPWLITGAVLAVVAVWVVAAIPVVRQNLDPCGPERAPMGASPAAVAYVRAINASRPEWLAMSKTIASQGYKVRPEQMLAQVNADQKFVTALKGISFPASQQPAADALITAVEQYDAFVQTSAQTPGYLTAHQADDQTLNNNRAAASSELRRELRLPVARCSYNRP